MNNFLIVSGYLFVVSPVLALPLPLCYQLIILEDSAITIRLEKRSPTVLRGVLVQNDKPHGVV